MSFNYFSTHDLYVLESVSHNGNAPILILKYLNDTREAVECHRGVNFEKKLNTGIAVLPSKSAIQA